MRKFNTRRPWQAGLIAATALSLVSLFAWRLHQSGQAEWSFALLFGSVWCLIGAFWANDGFIEESGLMLAEVMDQNVEFLQDQVQRLELELQELREQLAESATESFSLPRVPVVQDQWV